MLQILTFPVLTSTNDKGKELLRQDGRLALPLLIVAERQTAGRGREDRRWWTGPGALAFSLVVALEKTCFSRVTLPEFSAEIAAIVADSVREELPVGHEVSVHPPNDVYIDGQKVCGILIESPTPQHAIIGIGVNTNNSQVDKPSEFADRAIVTLRDLRGNRPVDNRRFLERLTGRLLERLSLPHA